MTPLELKPAIEFPIPALADLMTRGFEEYFVPIHVNDAALLTMIRRDGVDLSASRVLLKDGEPSAIALIARRGWVSRLAAMGVVSSARHQGVGTWIMNCMIEEARQREDREMVLEVIEQNEAGTRLYRKCGFEIVRRLVGFISVNPQGAATESLQEIDPRVVGRVVTLHGLSDLPWQISGESVAHHTPPTRAFQLDSAYALVANLHAKDAVLYSLLVEPPARGRGQAMKLLSALFAGFTERTWHVPALCPEEVGGLFEKAGFQKEKLSQWQMKLKLDSERDRVNK